MPPEETAVRLPSAPWKQFTLSIDVIVTLGFEIVTLVVSLQVPIPSLTLTQTLFLPIPLYFMVSLDSLVDHT